MLSKRLVFQKPKEVSIEQVDVPRPSSGQVLIKTLVTLISTGTELTMFSGDFPPGSAWERVAEYPVIPGYSNCGRIVEVGEDADEFEVGDRVLSIAPHAEHVLVDANKVFKVPERVTEDEAAFGVLGAIVMNGIRLANISLGESVVVVGVGLLGQLACQLSTLCGGFPVVAVDLSKSRLKLAKDLGVTAVLQSEKDNVQDGILSHTRGRGADVVLEVTGDPDVVSWALKLVKPQGRYILLSSPRGPSTVDFHDEVNWVSRVIIGTHMMSHPRFETPFNPWTVKRNIELFLDLISTGKIRIKDLVTNRYPWTKAEAAYQMLLEPTGDRLEAMGVLLDFE